MSNLPFNFDSDTLLSILRRSKDATAIYSDENLTIAFANEAMMRLWGKANDLTGSTLEQALPELEGQPFVNLLKEVWRTGQTYRATNTPADMVIDGELRRGHYDFIYEALPGNQGKTLCILHTATEVSDRVAAWKEIEERHLKEQELNEELTAAMEEYRATGEELQQLNEQYQVVNEEFQAANEQLESYQAELEEANLLLTRRNTLLVDEKTALSDAERKALSLMADAPVAIAVLSGPEMIVESANPMILKLWSKKVDVIGMPLAPAFPELEGQSFFEILGEVYRSGEPYRGNEVKAVINDGGKLTDRFFNFVYQPIHDPSGGIRSIMVVATDVTAQVDARKEAHDLNERFRLALSAGMLGSYELDIRTGKMICSDQCKRNFGLKPKDRLDFPDLLHAILPEHRSYVEERVNEAIQTKGVYTAEYQITWPDGSRHWITASGRPRYDESGNPVMMVGVTLDITERRLFEQQKDDFLSIASHELKTPITSLKANYQLLERLKDQPGNPIVPKLLGMMGKSIHKLAALTDELLNVKRLDEGRIMLHKTTFALNELMENCCTHVRTEGEYELAVSVSPHLWVFADEHRVDQVITNFVNNAVKYAPGSKKIFLSAEKIAGEIKISVRDTGPGIPKDQVPHLFDRFWRASHSGSEYTGLGLGLYICAEIVRAHGGEIGVETEIGNGSTFWFTLPN
ncbi:ATP-binding protein [Hufsiella ginkgonis]|uniref:histidine kinase n=1 Tax=Hufsiella ginkgonis TaxID=2695274 RepID=A0A7K1XRY9_9SPHI|nr:ATP-binding protein [Hufsiella ginkgonis]MXV13761.1 PAS domain-containing protein [Hufsiella ginkgonis]